MLMTNLVMRHSTSDTWSEDYFKNSEMRLTALTKDLLPPHYYESFFKTCVDMFSHVLFRAKVSNLIPSAISIITVWDHEDTYREFYQRVEGEMWFSALAKSEIQFEFSKTSVSRSQILTIIDQCFHLDPKVLHVVANEYRRSGMIIGDPFKGDTLVRVE